ncbi:hypothetical protein ACHAXS_003245 [Conticribra weissflogii]
MVNPFGPLSLTLQRRHMAFMPCIQHPLLPLQFPERKCESKKTTPQEIQESFGRCNIDQVAFIRHGNTAPSATGLDFDRQLTDLGRSQCTTAGASYGTSRLMPYYKHGALCSPAPRCVETAQLFLDASCNTENSLSGKPPLILDSRMYDGTMQPEGSRLFRSIGYAPLREYLENPDTNDANAAKFVLGGYARTSLDVIWEEVIVKHVLDKVEKNSDSKKGETLLFFAHAIYLPSAALGLASAVGCIDEELDIVLDTNTKEAQGYLVHIKDQVVSLLQRPGE